MTLAFSANPQNKNLVYVSGPMTGYSELNTPAFRDAADSLRSLGFTPVDPSVHVIEDALWSDYLRVDLADMLMCSGVALLPGWESSRGARLEIHVAKELGMSVLPLATWIENAAELLDVPEDAALAESRS